MPTTMTVPAKPGPMLSLIARDWADRGWPLEQLAAFRMEAGGGDGGDVGDQGGGSSGAGSGAGQGTGTGGSQGGDGASGADDGGDQGDQGDQLGDAGKRALAAERKARADAEKRAKAAEAELDKARKAQMTDQEKAVEAAKAEGRREAAMDVAAARIEAALTGVVKDPAAIVEDLNLARYVGDDGKVDGDAIKALAEKYRSLGSQGQGGSNGGGHPDLGQGRRGTGGAKPSGSDLWAARHGKKT